MKKKCFISFVIAVFLFSNFISSLAFVVPVFAEGSAGQSDEVVYKDGTYEVPLEVLYNTENKPSLMQQYVENPTFVDIIDGNATVRMTLTNSDLITDFQVKQNGTDYSKVTTVSNDAENNKRIVSFDVSDISKLIPGKISVDAEGSNKSTHDIRLKFDLSGLSIIENDSETDSEASSEPSKEIPTETGNNPSENADESKDNSPVNKPNHSKNDRDNKSSNIETNQGQKDEPNVLTDGTYTFSYTTEGADISRSFENTIDVIVKDGKQYLQLKGKSMRQFVEFLYIDGKQMAIGPGAKGSGAYVAQVELTKPLREKNEFTFVMVINARGTLMNHETKIKLDLKSKRSNLPLIEDTSESIKADIVDSDNKSTIPYITEGANISGFFENKVTIVEKAGKQYLQLHGTKMQQFVDALYINGNRMAIGPATNDRGAYLAQIELPEPLKGDEKFNFTMLVNANGRIMMHNATIILDEKINDDSIGLADGDYSIGLDVLYQNEDKPSTAGKYLVSPTKLSVKDGQAQLFIKLTDHEVITDFLIEQDGKFISPKVVQTNEKANTRIVAFHIDHLDDVIDAKVKVFVEQLGYSSEQPFRIILKKGTVTDYEGSLEQDDNKVTDLTDGLYSINYRVLEDDSFKKSKYGSSLEAPAQLKVTPQQNIVTITLKDEQLKEFQIEQNGKFKKIDIEATDKSRTVNFEISGADAVVNAKINGENVRLFFEENSVQEIQQQNLSNRAKPDKAYKLGYTILKENSKETSSANDYFTHEAILLEVGKDKYAQITTTDGSGKFIKYLKNKLGNQYEDMVFVNTNDKGATTYQFKVAGLISEPVDLDMFIDVEGFYQSQHYATLVFDTTGQVEVNADEYELITSEDITEPKDPVEPEKPVETDDPDLEPKPKEDSLVPDKAYQLNYTIMQEKENKPSVANSFFTHDAVLLELGKDKYVQIKTTKNSGKFIKSLKNKLGNKFAEMVIVNPSDQSGATTYQFKVNGPLSEAVILDMIIDVPGVYENQQHGARLIFDTTNMTETDASKYKLTPSTNENGPDGENAVTPGGKGGGGQSTPPPGTKDNVKHKKNKQKTTKTVKPDEAAKINYVILQENEDNVSVANNYFTNQAVLLTIGKDTYVQIATKNGSAKFIDSLKSKVSNKYSEMFVVETTKSGDKVYQFKLDGSIHDHVLLDMIITVPGIYENQGHKARLVFDPKSKEDVNPDDYLIHLGSNSQGVATNDNIDKPTFGNSDTNTDNQSTGKTDNPKTFDRTKIMLYVLLLIGASSALIIQRRKRLIKHS